MLHTNQKGSILIYTITAMAAMSLPIIYLSALSIQKLKASRNIETSIIAYYKAESGTEQILHQTKENLKNKDVLDTNMPSGPYQCQTVGSVYELYQDCYNLDIQYSADELNLDLPPNQTIQLNLYDLNDSAQDLPALIDRLRLESPIGLGRFEFTAVYWDKTAGVDIKNPVKKIINDDNSDNIIDYVFDADIKDTTPDLKFGIQYLAKIRITALDPAQLLKITMYDGDPAIPTNKRAIPGFITLKATGDEGNTQQAIKAVRAYNATNYFSASASGLWDFVLFSGSGITK